MMRILTFLLLALVTNSANAALMGRAPLTADGADYQAYYDDVLGITWLADANYAKTSGYDPTGRMTWLQSLDWIASLNAQDNGVGYLGVTHWRLPEMIDTGRAGCEGPDYVGTDCGYNVDVQTGELAHMYYATLGNAAAFDTNGVVQGCFFDSPYYCLSNTGPFKNIGVRAFYLYANQYWYYEASGWGFGSD